jgi:hypothetical protein
MTIDGSGRNEEMTPQKLEVLRAELLVLVARTVMANLNDPDLAGQSLEYKAGYRRGFSEASLVMIEYHLRKLT